MTLVYDLCGYQKSNGALAVEYTVAPRLLPLVRLSIEAAPDDPDLILPYELSDDTVAVLAKAMGLSIDPAAFRFWFEASDGTGASAGTPIAAEAR